MKKWLFFLSGILQFACSGEAQEKINGVSFVASRDTVAQHHIDPVLAVNANSAAVMPFAFMREVRAPKLIFDTDRQWYGETRKGARQYIEALQRNGIQVMLKPQIWVWRGVFTGSITMENEAQWEQLERSYEDFILTYAKLAQETQVALFCIGTELEQFVASRPGFWEQLIIKVRNVYKGKLTYAANWDEYKRTPFWAQLDYIGIDAYFPLTDARTPSLEQLKEGWEPWKAKIAALSKRHERPVLFTEFGYRSIDHTAKRPWEADRSETGLNLQAQVHATQAILEVFWKEDWFAGGYVWKWFLAHETAGGPEDNRFTPQNKPAEGVLADFYGVRKF